MILPTLKKTVKRLKPRIVGLYANIITRENVFRLARIAKANGVEFVVVGGPDASEWCDQYFANGVDIIGLNEGELTLEELIPWLQTKGMKDLEQVPGIMFMKNGRIHRTPPRPAITDLDSLPWPDRDVLKMDEYFNAWKSHHGESSVSLITARGCPFHCAWCSSEVFGHTHRQRSPKDVVDEMLMLKQRYNPDIMWISDDVLTINKKWTHEFVREVKARNAQHPYECLSRVWIWSTTKFLKGLRETGCFRIWYGAESGSQKVLDSMRKGTTVAQVREAARITQELGMQAGFFILLGYPDETTADIRMTIDFLKETRPDVVGTSVAFPIKGTEFYERVGDRLIPDENWSSRNQNKLLFKGKIPAALLLVCRALAGEGSEHRSDVAHEKAAVRQDYHGIRESGRGANRRRNGGCGILLSLPSEEARQFPAPCVNGGSRYCSARSSRRFRLKYAIHFWA